MSQTKRLYYLFKINGWKLHAGTIWANYMICGRKYTSRLSDLRRFGFDVYCDPSSEETNRLYEIRNPNHFPWQWKEKISEAGVQTAEAVGVVDTSPTDEHSCGGGLNNGPVPLVAQNIGRTI